MENYGIPLASELLSDEGKEALANWAKLPENKKSMERIGKSIRFMNEATDGSGLLIDFPVYLPEFSHHDIQCALYILTASGYTVEPDISYRARDGVKQPVVNIRVSWDNRYQPI